VSKSDYAKGVNPILKSVLIGVGALIYGASPIDVIPELFAGPLGFGDDAIVLVAAGVAIWRILRKRGRGDGPPITPRPEAQ
jgi:uncharacterized membrane protein YkvA (DUF1232 family)